MRATDRGREQAVGKLRGAYLQGALSTDTFETRAAVAYRSRTVDELAGVVDDLPTAWEHARRYISAWFRASFHPLAVVDAREVELPRAVGARMFVGRHRNCDVVIEDRSVSRWHLEISYDGSGWEARDLASTNGTFIWDRRISAAQARPEDVLYVGNTTLRLVECPR